MSIAKLISADETKLLCSMLLFLPACAAESVALVALVGLLAD